MENVNEVIKQAKEKIETICKEYQVTLMPVVVHQGDRTFSTIDIVPLAVVKQQPTPAPEASTEEAPKAE